MSLTFLLLALVPIIAFAIADAMAGLKTGVIVAVVLSVVLFVVNWMILGKFDPIGLIEPVFFIILGLISLHLKNGIWFKFQPVVVNVLSALLLAGFQIWSEPFLVRWAPAIDKLMLPERQGFLVSPPILDKLALISHVLIYVFILHAVWVGWAALKKSTWVWTAVRLAGYPLLLGSVVVCMLI
jgi:intracellular septation protein